MTKEDITKYEYCKKHLDYLQGLMDKFPVEQQKYGCGTGRPNIEYQLQKIHQNMYSQIFVALECARDEINMIVEKI